MVSWWCFFWTVTNEGPPPRNDRMLTCHCQKNVFALRSGFTDNLNDNIQCIKRHLCKLAYIYIYLHVATLLGGKRWLNSIIGENFDLSKGAYLQTATNPRSLCGGRTGSQQCTPCGSCTGPRLGVWRGWWMMTWAQDERCIWHLQKIAIKFKSTTKNWEELPNLFFLLKQCCDISFLFLRRNLPEKGSRTTRNHLEK